MTIDQFHWREAGRGPPVICFHSNASVSGQWRELMDRMADRHRIFAPDSYGAGKTRDWHSDRVITLQDEVDLIAPLLKTAGTPVSLVGHSYGAAIALRLAVTSPASVRAIAVYEPTLFSLIDAETAPPNDADGIRNAVAASAEAIDRGDNDSAARAFIDYWMGDGAWDNTPQERKPAIAASVVKVRRWAHALTTEPTPLSAFAALRVPVLYMTGGRSPRSAHGVAERLIPALPLVKHVAFPKLGHMGPITHPSDVNDAIDRFFSSIG